jgi:peptidoglycan/xylan/chitin deacetylase (PgdA/CDA1 family)
VSRIVSFCFDDGFLRSGEKICSLFSQRGQRACFAVLAAPEFAVDPFIRGAMIADWGFWREAQAAGHEIAPHGYAHEHLGRMTLADAKASVEAALQAFGAELPNFEPQSAVFHLAYLTAPGNVVDWLSSRMLGVRARGDRLGLNDLPPSRPGGLIDCITFGPEAVEEMLAARISRFLREEEGWLVLVLHGLDGEGWGTLPSQRLAACLDELLDAGVEIAPPGALIRRSMR